MMRNRPVVIKDMAKSWGATQKWSDFSYLKSNAATSTSLVSVLNSRFVPEGEKADFSLLKIRPHKVPLSLEKALEKIEENKETGGTAKMIDGNLLQPSIYFLDDDLLRAPRLRGDYEFPLLHKFLRL